MKDLSLYLPFKYRSWFHLDILDIGKIKKKIVTFTTTYPRSGTLVVDVTVKS